MGGQQGKKRKGGNPGVGVDFKKVKHKVGKKLPKAQNETDTSFKARNINLPSQAVTQDKDGVATNYHNLTLKELLGQVSHYSDKTRKAALVGLGDLFSKHPQELTGHVGLVYSRLVERMADTEESVRQGLQALLRGHVCPGVTQRQLRPFMPMIMAHMYGAMTHLSLDIRNDSLIFLDILMDHYSQLITSGFLAPCLSHFCDLLSSGHRSRSIRGQSLKSLLTILRALHDFLRRAFPSIATLSPATAVTSSQQPTDASHPAPASLPLLRHRCRWHVALPDASRATPTTKPSVSLAPNAKSLLSGSSTPGHSAPANEQGHGQGSQKSGQQEVAAVTNKLLMLLMECWPECSPATLSVSPTLDQSTALVLILACCRLLMENTLSSATPTTRQSGADAPGSTPINTISESSMHGNLPKEVLQQVLRNLTPHFPATMPAVWPSPPILEQMTQYNLGCAQVLVRLLPVTLGNPQPTSDPADVVPAPMQLPAWAQALVDFYTGVLRTGQVVQGAGLMSGSQSKATKTTTLGSSSPGVQAAGSKGAQASMPDVSRIPGTVYASVLAGVEDVVGLAPAATAGKLLAAMDGLALACPSKSGLRASCLQLQHRLMKKWQDGDLFLDPTCVAGWLGALPRLMWELGGSSPNASAMALSMLHDAARFCPDVPGTTTASDAAVEAALSPLQAALQKLQPQLAPLWAVQLPGRPGRKGGPATAGQVVAGPVTQLPEHVQLLAIDTLHHLGPLQPTLLSAALRVIHHQLLPSHSTIRLVEVCMWMATKSTPAIATSMILTLIFTPPPNTVADTATAVQRQWQVSSCVLQMSSTVAPASVLLQLLSAHLKPILQVVDGRVAIAATPDAVLRVHCVLWLSSRSLEDRAAGQRDTAPLPGWLEHALPNLALWYCMHFAEASIHQSAPVCSGWQGTGFTRTQSGEPAGALLVVKLCRAAPQHAPRLMDSAVTVTGKLRMAKGGQEESESQPTRPAEQYVAVLDLLCGLLSDKGLRRELLGQVSHVRDVVAQVVSADRLPGHITADMTCMTTVQRLKHAVEDLLGPGGH